MLCLCIVWAGYQLNSFMSGGTFGLLFAPGVSWSIMGAAQVGLAVSGARASGILDFHRVSPMTPTELTLGFFFGAPIREYVLFAAPCRSRRSAWPSDPEPPRVRPAHDLVFTTAWTFHGLALLNGLISKAKANVAVGGGRRSSSSSFFRWSPDRWAASCPRQFVERPTG